jgi:CheY-like chemotaxis protein
MLNLRRRNALPNNRTRTVKTILIIEDDPVLQHLYHKLLADSGYKIILSHNGPDGVAQALQQNPDLVILDLGLPTPKSANQPVEFDGFAVLRWLQRSARTRSIPVVVVSAWPADSAKAPAMELGATAFLPKPIRPDDLREALRILLGDDEHADASLSPCDTALARP